MEKVSIQVQINDYLISGIGKFHQNKIQLHTDQEELEYNLKKHILKKDNKELNLTMNFNNKTIKCLLKSENLQFVNKFDVFSLTNHDKQVNIKYRIEDTDFNLLIKYETI